MNPAKTKCAFCGEVVEVDERGYILLHHVMSPERYQGCGKYSEQNYPLFVCPFTSMAMEENLVHLNYEPPKEKGKGK